MACETTLTPPTEGINSSAVAIIKIATPKISIGTSVTKATTFPQKMTTSQVIVASAAPATTVQSAKGQGIRICSLFIFIYISSHQIYITFRAINFIYFGIHIIIFLERKLLGWLFENAVIHFFLNLGNFNNSLITMSAANTTSGSPTKASCVPTTMVPIKDIECAKNGTMFSFAFLNINLIQQIQRILSAILI